MGKGKDRIGLKWHLDVQTHINRPYANYDIHIIAQEA